MKVQLLILILPLNKRMKERDGKNVDITNSHFINKRVEKRVVKVNIEKKIPFISKASKISNEITISSCVW